MKGAIPSGNVSATELRADRPSARTDAQPTPGSTVSLCLAVEVVKVLDVGYGILLGILCHVELPRQVFVFVNAVVVPGLLYRRPSAGLLEGIDSVLRALGLRPPHILLARK